MSQYLSTMLVWLCCLGSISATAAAQDRPVDRGKPFVLEIRLVELMGAQPDDIEQIEKSAAHLTRLLSEGKARLAATLRVRTRAGDNFSARIGQRVPIQTASLPVFVNTTKDRGAGSGAVGGVPQIGYENTGLIVDGHSTVMTDGTLDISFKVEMTGLDRSTGNFTPTFMQRTLTDAIRLKEGETAVPMGLIQQEATWTPATQGSPGASNAWRGSFIVVLSAKPAQ